LVRVSQRELSGRFAQGTRTVSPARGWQGGLLGGLGRLGWSPRVLQARWRLGGRFGLAEGSKGFLAAERGFESRRYLEARRQRVVTALENWSALSSWTTGARATSQPAAISRILTASASLCLADLTLPLPPSPDSVLPARTSLALPSPLAHPPTNQQPTTTHARPIVLCL